MVAQRTRAPSAHLLRVASTPATLATAAFLGAMTWFAIPRVNGARGYADLTHGTVRGWRTFVKGAIPEQRAILFVRYTPTHYVHESLIANDPDLASARLWIVFDRGAENKKLAALAPERTLYLFDEQTRVLSRFNRTLARR
jgi:hypothetical protein